MGEGLQTYLWNICLMQRCQLGLQLEINQNAKAAVLKLQDCVM